MYKTIVLKNKPFDPNKTHEYQARLIKRKPNSKWILAFFIKRKGELEWDSTPGQWHATTILEILSSDKLYIDNNIIKIKEEILETIKDDLEIELEIENEKKIEEIRHFLELKKINDFENEREL